MYTVPDCPEWRAQPGFEACECYCVKMRKSAVADCVSCHGTGQIGVVPMSVADAAREKGPMPDWVGDRRFDFRVRMMEEIFGKLQKSEVKRKHDDFMDGLPMLFLFAVMIAAAASVLTILW